MRGPILSIYMPLPIYSSSCIIQLEFQTGPSLSAGKLRQDSNPGFISWPHLKAFCCARVFPRRSEFRASPGGHGALTRLPFSEAFRFSRRIVKGKNPGVRLRAEHASGQSDLESFHFRLDFCVSPDFHGFLGLRSTAQTQLVRSAPWGPGRVGRHGLFQ